MEYPSGECKCCDKLADENAVLKEQVAQLKSVVQHEIDCVDSAAEEINRQATENAALKEQVAHNEILISNLRKREDDGFSCTTFLYNEINSHKETIAQQAKIIKQMQEALSIAMINGDYLPNERKQLEKFL